MRGVCLMRMYIRGCHTYVVAHVRGILKSNPYKISDPKFHGTEVKLASNECAGFELSSDSIFSSEQLRLWIECTQMTASEKFAHTSVCE